MGKFEHKLEGCERAHYTRSQKEAFQDTDLKTWGSGEPQVLEEQPKDQCHGAGWETRSQWK